MHTKRGMEQYLEQNSGIRTNGIEQGYETGVSFRIEINILPTDWKLHR